MLQQAAEKLYSSLGSHLLGEPVYPFTHNIDRLFYLRLVEKHERWSGAIPKS